MQVSGLNAHGFAGPRSSCLFGLLGILVRAVQTFPWIDRHGVTRFTHVGFRPVDGATYEAQLLSTVAMLQGAGAQAYLEEQGVRHWLLE